MPTHNPFYTVSQLSSIIEEAHASLEVYEELWDLKKLHRKWDIHHRILCTFPAGVEMEEIYHVQDTCAEIDEKIRKVKSIILTIRPYWLSDEETSRITEESLNALESYQLEKLRALIDLDGLYKSLRVSHDGLKETPTLLALTQ
jgi:hypothetical protein